MTYAVRIAELADLPVIEMIYERARRFMTETGNPDQWGKTDPPHGQLVQDIRRRELYVLEDGGTIHGVFYFALGEDPTYAEIFDGNWGSAESYGTIHRIASDGSGGVFFAALAFCKERSNHLRIDTHHDNHVMQHVLEKNGFVRRGIIYIEDGTPRIAYEMT